MSHRTVLRLIILHAAGELALPQAVGLYYSAGLVHAMRWWLLDEKPAPADSLVETGMTQLQGMLGLGA